MCRSRIFVFFALTTLIAAPSVAADKHVAPAYARYASASTFADVMDALRLAIEERGLVINNVMHMKAMLDRTGADLGSDEVVYEQAESVEFCSAVLSRAMMAEDPVRIANCPFVIAVYTLPAQPAKTFVAYRRLPAAELERSEAMRSIDAMLSAIAEQAISW